MGRRPSTRRSSSSSPPRGTRALAAVRPDRQGRRRRRRLPAAAGRRAASARGCCSSTRRRPAAPARPRSTRRCRPSRGLVARGARAARRCPRLLPTAHDRGLAELAAGWVLDGRAAQLPELHGAADRGHPDPAAGAGGRGARRRRREPRRAARRPSPRRPPPAHGRLRRGRGARRPRRDAAVRRRPAGGRRARRRPRALHRRARLRHPGAGRVGRPAGHHRRGRVPAAAGDPPLAAHRALRGGAGPHRPHARRSRRWPSPTTRSWSTAVSALRQRYIALFFQLIAGQVPVAEQRAPQPLAALEVVLDGILATLRRFAQQERHRRAAGRAAGAEPAVPDAVLRRRRGPARRRAGRRLTPLAERCSPAAFESRECSSTWAGFLGQPQAYVHRMGHLGSTAQASSPQDEREELMAVFAPSSTSSGYARDPPWRRRRPGRRAAHHADRLLADRGRLAAGDRRRLDASAVRPRGRRIRRVADDPAEALHQALAPCCPTWRRARDGLPVVRRAARPRPAGLRPPSPHHRPLLRLPGSRPRRPELPPANAEAIALCLGGGLWETIQPPRARPSPARAPGPLARDQLRLPVDRLRHPRSPARQRPGTARAATGRLTTTGARLLVKARR